MKEKEFGKFTLDEIKQLLVLFKEFKNEPKGFSQDASQKPGALEEQLTPSYYWATFYEL